MAYDARAIGNSVMIKWQTLGRGLRHNRLSASLRSYAKVLLHFQRSLVDVRRNGICFFIEWMHRLDYIINFRSALTIFI